MAFGNRSACAYHPERGSHDSVMECGVLGSIISVAELLSLTTSVLVTALMFAGVVIVVVVDRDSIDFDP